MKHRIDRSRIAGRLAAALLAGTCLSSPAWAVDFNVNSDASLRSAITSAGSGDRIVFTGNVTLAADLPAVQTNVTIVGNGNSLSGNNQFRGLFIGAFSGAAQVPVTVAVQDLTITDTRARGGTGGQRGGGGAGLGGAIFVANQATLTVSNVNLTNNSAVGGNGGVQASGLGGGGGMGGNGGTQVGGGGGLGAGATGGNNNTSAQGGIATGASSGGTAGSPGATGAGANGGGGGGNNSGGAPPQGSAGGGGVGGGTGGGVGAAGGAGGFGGGGGSASASGGAGGKGGFGGGGAGSGGLGATAGAGGFGGGGGSGSGAGAGGFGGGNGVTTAGAGGGGGAGMGGAIFVQQGGNLNIAGAFTVSGNSVTAGSGTTGGGNGSAFGAGIFLQGNGTVNFAPDAGVVQTLSNAIADQTGSGGTGANAGSYALNKSGAGTLVLQSANAYSGGTTVSGGLINFAAANNFGSGAITLNGGGLQWATGNTLDISSRLAALGAGGGTFDTNGNNVTFATGLGGGGGLTKNGAGMLTLQAANTYTGGTTLNAGILFLDSVGGALASSGALTVNGGVFDMSDTAAGQTVGALSGAGGTIALGSKVLTTNSAANTTLATLLIDGGLGGGIGGALVKAGTGTLTLTAFNSYTGGTTVSGGLINFNSALNFGSGAITLNGGGLQWAAGTTTDISSRLVLGAAGATIDTNGNNVTFASGLSGTGTLAKQGSGMLSLNGANTYSGGTNVFGGTLAVNGSVSSPITLFSGSTLAGSGTTGTVVAIAATLAPGNSIGTLTVNGNFAQLGGVYQVEANAAGQSDRINVAGTATISNGATVQALAQPGNYGRSTTYTILRANAGISGTYSGVTSNFAFLTPSLSYDANDVFLTLVLNSFSFGGRTYNQRQVGRTLDQTFNAASGDYATVLNAIAGLGTANGPQTLDAISGQNYAGFGNAMVQGAQLFLSNFANRAGSRSGGGTRVALAEACDVACDATTPALWGAWGGAVGGTGTIAGNDNAGTFTYSVGGFSGGLDRRFGDNFLAGITVGYQTGGQWTGGFDGRSVTDSVQAGLYASFLQGPLYVDAVAAYAYSSNQLWRPINIAGLQPRTAYGQAGANQFLGQIETGWRFDLGGAPGYFITPFALLQGSVATQNGLTETGAQSLNLSVAQQSTSSLRTIFGAQLGASMDVGLRDKLAAQLRLGWSHEYSDTARPVTASFAGAPSVPFTVFGAAPTRDGAVLGFSVSTAIAEAMGVYLRYEGTIAGQDSSHALTAGLRMSW